MYSQIYGKSKSWKLTKEMPPCLQNSKQNLEHMLSRFSVKCKIFIIKYFGQQLSNLKYMITFLKMFTIFS